MRPRRRSLRPSAFSPPTGPPTSPGRCCPSTAGSAWGIDPRAARGRRGTGISGPPPMSSRPPTPPPTTPTPPPRLQHHDSNDHADSNHDEDYDMTDQLGTGLLAGKNLLITGIITEASMAFHTARLAQQQGATVVLTGFGRLSLVERIAKRLPAPAPVVELDVTDKSQMDSLADRVGAFLPRLDGVLHSIGYAPATALVGGFLDCPWEDVATTVHTSSQG